MRGWFGIPRNSCASGSSADDADIGVPVEGAAGNPGPGCGQGTCLILRSEFGSSPHSDEESGVAVGVARDKTLLTIVRDA